MSDLLEPTLTRERAPVALYSMRSGFWVAFLGGPAATAIYTALNSRRLGRLARDLWLYIGGVALAYAALYLATLFEPFDLAADEGRRNARLLSRGLALALWGGYFLRLRPHYRAMEVMGTAPSPPWKAAVTCILVGGAIGFGVALLLAHRDGLA